MKKVFIAVLLLGCLFVGVQMVQADTNTYTYLDATAVGVVSDSYTNWNGGDGNLWRTGALKVFGGLTVLGIAVSAVKRARGATAGR